MNNDDKVTKLHKQTKNSSAVWLQYVSKIKCEARSKLFVFTEAEDDCRYYIERIKEYTNFKDDEYIVKFPCSGKKAVLDTMEKIQKDKRSKAIKKCFFIDMDFDERQVENEELYETPCYAIENFYISNKVFGKILCHEFMMNTDDDDYKKCMKDYSIRKNEFHKEILLLNAWCAYGKEEKYDLGLSGFSIKKFFKHITLEKIETKNEINLETIKKEFPKINLEINDEKIKQKSELLRKNPEYYFRGKFELEFLKSILNFLANKDESDLYLKNQISKNKNIQDILSRYSKHADTPRCLVDFLKKYKLEI